MGNQISQQMLVFLQSILLGASAGVVYDVLRPFRRLAPRAAGWLDALYCLLCAGAAFVFLVERGGGELRGFAVLGAAGGAAVYLCAAAPLLRPVWAFWAETLAELVRCAMVPLRWAGKLCRKI